MKSSNLQFFKNRQNQILNYGGLDFVFNLNSLAFFLKINKLKLRFIKESKSYKKYYLVKTEFD
jgi:hypothetical protein